MLLTLLLAATTYTTPGMVQWKKDPTGSYVSATLFGKDTDSCGAITRAKFKDGTLYPWHTNGVDTYATIVAGTLVVGFDRNHARDKEVPLNQGSVMLGLATEPHYARAIGETIFDITVPCPARKTTVTTHVSSQTLHWTQDTYNGKKIAAQVAMVSGKDSDKCGQIYRRKFPNGFEYPWHVNGVGANFEILQGTLVIGYDKKHDPKKELALPAGSTMQGLATEPHYGRAIGETIFDAYVPCPAK